MDARVDLLSAQMMTLLIVSRSIFYLSKNKARTETSGKPSVDPHTHRRFCASHGTQSAGFRHAYLGSCEVFKGMLLYIDVLLIMEGVYVTESELMIFPRPWIKRNSGCCYGDVWMGR